MIIEVDGEEIELDDAAIRAYVAEMDAEKAEEAPPNKYIFGVNVTHTKELGRIGNDIRAFIDTIGDGEIEVQVSINAKLNEFKDKVMGFTANRDLEPAIGEIDDSEDYDDYDEWEDWEDEEDEF